MGPLEMQVKCRKILIKFTALAGELVLNFVALKLLNILYSNAFPSLLPLHSRKIYPNPGHNAIKGI